MDSLPEEVDVSSSVPDRFMRKNTEPEREATGETKDKDNGIDKENNDGHKDAEGEEEHFGKGGKPVKEVPARVNGDGNDKDEDDDDDDDDDEDDDEEDDDDDDDSEEEDDDDDDDDSEEDDDDDDDSEEEDDEEEDEDDDDDDDD